MNKQPILKQHLDEKGMLVVHSIFNTIQGEGPFAGVPAVFIRLYGCNLQCPLCDTDYTSMNNLSRPCDVLSQVLEVACPPGLIVITGGEPFRQNITPLVHLLLRHGFKVQIETNGTLYLPDLPYDKITVICSPKTGSLNPELKKHIYAYKYVLCSSSVDPVDGLPGSVLGHPVHNRVARPDDMKGKKIYLQPADEKNPSLNKKNLQAAILSCMSHGYILCLQVHKIIDME